MQLVLRLNLPFVPGDANLECTDRPPPVGTAGLGGGAERGRLCPAASATLTPYRRPLTAGAARLEQANDEGGAVYTVTLTAHYTMKWSDTFED